MSHIFISYSREDSEFARYLRAQLESHGFRVWMDEQRLHPGTDWWDEIEDNIISCSAFMIVMSPNSANSKWVKREILCAEDNHRPIFPVLLAGKIFARLADLHAEDMTGGIAAKLSPRLLDSLHTLIAPDTSKNLIVRLTKGFVQNIPADALVLKFSGTFHGASAQVFEALKQFGVRVSIDVLKSEKDAYQLLDSNGATLAPKVLYVSTPFLRNFKYADLTAFIKRSFALLKEQVPDVRHIAMTIHGVKFGLDEREAFITQMNAIFETVISGDAPSNLEQVSIIETDASRVSRLIDIADEFTDKRDDVVTVENDMGAYQLVWGKTTSEIPAVNLSDVKPYILALMPPDDNYDDPFYYGIQRQAHTYGLLCERESSEWDAESLDDFEALQVRIAEARGVIIHLGDKPVTPDFALQIGCAWGAKRPLIFISQENNVKHRWLPKDRILHYKKISELELLVADYLKTML